MNRFQVYKKPWKTDEKGEYFEFNFNRDDTAHVRQKFLWWQEEGLSETAFGYGNALRTSWQVFVEKRWRRVYCTIHGNIGTTWVILNKEPVLVDIL